DSLVAQSAGWHLGQVHFSLCEKCRLGVAGVFQRFLASFGLFSNGKEAGFSAGKIQIDTVGFFRNQLLPEHIKNFRCARQKNGPLALYLSIGMRSKSSIT
ncbi:MAG: hypothetical protein HY360_18675, partial [Verrucomicrobia bacterium]|nr:hypothetical protein [Verrucomicrobiota bacterium]